MATTPDSHDKRKAWLASQEKKVFQPNWEAIMKILGEPKQDAVYTNRSMDPGSMDGAWDFQAASRGFGMRRVHADIGKSTTDIETPTAFVFVCECGYSRRVIVETEQSFTCERPNASGAPGCGIIWQQVLEESDEVNVKNGGFVKRPVYEEKSSIGKIQRKYMMPKIRGRYVKDMVRETELARRAAGLPTGSQYQPQSFGKKDAPEAVEEPIVVPEPPVPSTAMTEHMKNG
jgi:hypothetical protein